MQLSKNDHIVADIGAGSGYFSFRISPLVPEGKVHAVDISPSANAWHYTQMQRKEKEGFENVVTVQSSIKSTTLETESIDCALIVDAYHEFSYPREMALSILNSLKKKGRLILIEYRKEDPKVPIKLLQMSQKQAIKEITSVGFIWKKPSISYPNSTLWYLKNPLSKKNKITINIQIT